MKQTLGFWQLIIMPWLMLLVGSHPGTPEKIVRRKSGMSGREVIERMTERGRKLEVGCWDADCE